jgi:hypothetical protein
MESKNDDKTLIKCPECKISVASDLVWKTNRCHSKCPLYRMVPSEKEQADEHAA